MPYKNKEDRRKFQRENYRKNRDRWMQLVIERGGFCEDCGYDKYPEVLHFHHRNPEDKKFNIGRSWTRSLKSMKEEAEKCDLLCPTCHRVRHLLWIIS